MNPRNQGNQGDRDISGISATYGGAEFISSQFGKGGIFDSNKAGYNPNINANFFERIDYVLYHAQKGVQYSLINPVMTGFTHTPIDYASNELMEFTMSFQYESFTTYDEVNFRLSDIDLARFEDVSGLSSTVRNFQDDNSGSIAANTQRDLQILGNKNDPRPRTFQPMVGQSADDFGPTYKEVFTTYAFETPNATSVGTGFAQDIFGEFLGDVADKALSAAINGADVKDAALGAVFDNVAGIISENNRPDRRPPIVENPAEENENPPATPPEDN
jgi:hypothetical protein